MVASVKAQLDAAWKDAMLDLQRFGTCCGWFAGVLRAKGKMGGPCVNRTVYLPSRGVSSGSPRCLQGALLH